MEILWVLEENIDYKTNKPTSKINMQTYFSWEKSREKGMQSKVQSIDKHREQEQVCLE